MQQKKLFLILTCSQLLYASTPATPSIHIPINISNSGNMNPNLNNENHALFQQLQVAEIITQIKATLTSTITRIETGYQHFKDRCTSIKNRTFGFFEQSKNLIIDHKYKLIATAILSICGYTVYKVFCANSYLAKESLWSSWNQELGMEELMAIPHHEMAQQLMIEVQRRYVNPNDPANFLSPMIEFMEDVEKELSQLHRYNRLYTWSSKIYLKDILPFNKKLFDQLSEKIARLLYFKNGFASWVAQYKMLNALKRSRIMTRSKKSFLASKR